MQSRACRGGGRADLLGFYHSHPDHPARPSQYDLDHALPSFSYVIISVSSASPRRALLEAARRSLRVRRETIVNFNRSIVNLRSSI
jgi:proteasome lid subunit RPN8/RPN11